MYTGDIYLSGASELPPQSLVWTQFLNGIDFGDIFFFLHVKPSNIDFYFSYNGIR